MRISYTYTVSAPLFHPSNSSLFPRSLPISCLFRGWAGWICVVLIQVTTAVRISGAQWLCLVRTTVFSKTPPHPLALTLFLTPLLYVPRALVVQETLIEMLSLALINLSLFLWTSSGSEFLYRLLPTAKSKLLQPRLWTVQIYGHSHK